MVKIGMICNIPTDVAMFEKAYENISGVELRIYDLKGGFEEFKEFCKDCCIVVAKLMGGKNAFPVEEFHEFLIRHGVHFCPTATLHESQEELKKFSTVSNEDWQTIMRYLSYEGVENYRNLILFLANRFGGVDTKYGLPKIMEWQGIYRGKVYGREYLEMLDPEKPTVGVLFYRSWWVGGDLDHVDALISELEKYANVVAVFSERRPNDFGACGFEKAVEEFFIKDGKVVIDVLVNMTLFSLTANFFGLEKADFLTKLDVPLLQAISATTLIEDWESSTRGLNPTDVVISAAMPEFDSAIIHFPIACRKRVEVGKTGAEILKFEPIPDRVQKFARLAVRYAMLRRKKNSEKRVAIVLHNYPPRNDRIASAFGLDSLESVAKLLKRLRGEGYEVDWVPKDGNELVSRILQNITNDQRFLTPEIADRMRMKVDLNLPEDVERKMEEHWGKLPGNAFVYENDYLLPVLRNGNVLIALQPPRGFEEDPERVYHDPDLPPTYQYLAFYRYISEKFKADAIVHVGKHGTLEWLPGKSFGLSQNCFPDVCMDIPHFYIYIVNDPGEGTQAKRRAYACIIDHLTPAFTTADLYDDYLLLEKMINEYYDAMRYGRKGEEYRRSIIEKARELRIVEGEEDVERVHEVLLELKMSMINSGLHIFGEGLKGEELVETILSVLRFKHADRPSILELAAERLGYNIDLPNEECVKIYGKTKSAVMDEILEEARRMISEVLESGGNELADVILDLKRKLEENEEMDALIRALDGRYVKPGMSGAITRNPRALPTGRNFYSCNPWEIPTEQAYESGRKLAEELLKRYLEEEGKYPETVGVIIWCSPTMRTHGEDVAEFLYLLGVRPRYDSIGRVVGLEVIPLEELGRPRIDVVARVSGMFRDAFFNLIELMDDAVKLVASLDEPEDMNYVKKHAEDGKLLRVFSDMPGAYGAGVSKVLESKNWESIDDLARAYISWGCYAYGRGKYGVKAEEEFKKILRIVEVTVKNEDSQEWDIFEGDDFNAYHGGMIATIKALGGNPKSYVGDSSDPSVRVRSLKDEGKRVYRTKVMNPKWIEAMKEHGYKGAEYFSKYIDHIFQWDATSGIVEDWMYQGIAEKYVFDEEMQNFFRKNNPYALMNIAERLLEAIQRGMWNADDETRERLRKIYLETEAELE